MRFFLAISFFVLIFSSCKDDPATPEAISKYTIQGKILDGETMRAFSNLPIEILVTKGSGSGYKSQTLAITTTNDTGWFSVTYEKTDITGNSVAGYPYRAQIRIHSQFTKFEEIPVNENVSKDFYHPTKGQLKVFLKTDNPLEANHDTLFLAYYDLEKVLKIDTITKTVNNLYTTIIARPEHFQLVYGRNHKEFQYYPVKREVKGKVVDVFINGDPVIDKATIQY